MSWIILFFAGLFEVGWAVGLKYTDGFTRPLPTVLTVAAMAVSLGLLGLAMKELPLGTAYAIWTGVGGENGHCWDHPVWRIDGVDSPGQCGVDRHRTDRAQGQRLSRCRHPSGMAAFQPTT